MESKILDIQDLLSRAPFKIAPEHAAELWEWQNNESVSLTIDMRGLQKHSMSVDIETKKITVAIQFLEFLWAGVHLHYCFFKEYEKFQASGKDVFHFREVPKIENAIAGFDEAHSNLIDGTNIDIWKNIEIVPSPNTTSELQFIVQELFLMSFSWVVHHELSHLKLGHGIELSSRSLQEEKDADVEATLRIVPDLSVQGYGKRAMGIVSAILCLISIRQAPSNNPSHPCPEERLDLCLEKIGLPDNDSVYRYVSIVLLLFFAQEGVSKDGSGTYKEIYSELLCKWYALKKS